jgi:hypothetical protein
MERKRRLEPRSSSGFAGIDSFCIGSTPWIQHRKRRSRIDLNQEEFLNHVQAQGRTHAAHPQAGPAREHPEEQEIGIEPQARRKRHAADRASGRAERRKA